VLIAIVLATVQMPWTAALPPHGASLDILRPKLEGGGTSFTSVAAYASARMPLGAGAALRIELPFARLANSAGVSSSSFGNPYIGIESGRQTGVTYEAGLRGPLASDTEIAPQLGALSDVTRVEAFLPDAVILSMRARYRFRDEGSGFTFDAGGGPSLWVATSGDADAELVVHHHMAAGRQGRHWWLAVGFGGWTVVSSDGGSIGERTVNQVGASIGSARGKARPAFHVIVPLSQVFTNVTIVLGVGLAIAAN
jgi:hypothetical protein